MTILQYLHHLDQSVTLSINGFLCSSFTDAVWQLFSNKYVWFPMYFLVILYVLHRLGWKKGGIVILSCVLTIFCCDQFANFTKETVARLRPCWDLKMLDGGLRVLEWKGNLFGFYSAHAANAMGFAVCSSLGLKFDKRLRYRGYSIPVIIWAVLVGISRVFVGKHFFGDVMVGFIIGAAFALAFNRIAFVAVRTFKL